MPSSPERRPLSPRNAWALIGLASGDQSFSERYTGLLELAPRLRRRASALVLRLPAQLVAELDHDASLVRTGLSAARPYRWSSLVCC